MKVGDAFARLGQAAGALGLIDGDAQFVGVYYDDPDVTPVEQRRAHAGLTVPVTFGPAPAGFELIDVPGGDFAVGVHRGPYEKLPESYKWLFGQWLASSGREPANEPAREVYVNDPATTPQADLITLIQIALVPEPATTSVR